MQRYKGDNLASSIIRTLVYADLFDYPLNSEELCRFLITKRSLDYSVFQKALSRIITNDKRINTNNNFYFLKGKGKIVWLRKKRAEWSREKLEVAQRTTEKLKIIPTIKMVSVIGALAMSNCGEDDDIDLLVISSQNSLWLTRLMIVLLSSFMGINRRRPEDTKVKDKICFNLFLEERHLEIIPHNLFLAHEVCQVRPLFNKNKTYEKFLWENRWVKKFLPNAVVIARPQDSKVKVRPKHLISQYLNILISFFDQVVYRLQYFYMKPKITCEKINLHQAFFHPSDISQKINKEYEANLRSLGLDKRGGEFI